MSGKTSGGSLETGPEHTQASPPAFTEARVSQLLELFPEVAAEGQIDWDQLRAVLGDDAVAAPDRWVFRWAGKREAQRILQVPSRATLLPDAGESVDFEASRNVVIEGENLEVLRLLYKPYFGAIKLIYLDPPYNRGKNDLIYQDDFTDPLGSYLRDTGQADESGNLLTSNPDIAGRHHGAWLSMMYPRLLLARQLLSPDGALVVSCNDVEQANLKLLLSEVFGEENHAATLIWHNDGNIDQQSKIKVNHEYLHVYVRDLSQFSRPGVIDPNVEETSKLYNDEIQNSITKNGAANPPSVVLLPAGFPAAFEEGTIKAQDKKYPYFHDDIVVAGGRLTAPARVESGWSSKNLLKLFIDNGHVPIEDAEGKETRFAITETGAIYGYKLRAEKQGHVLSVIRNVGTTKQNSSRLTDWGLHFDYPKPVLLLRYLCEIFTQPTDIVLDLFAGSGTMAEAVMRLNRADGGSRRFILVQYPEPTDEKSKARKAGFEHIAQMTRERVRKAGEELAATPTIGEASHHEDLGFRAYRLGASHFAPWEGTTSPEPEQYAQEMAMFEDPLIGDWTVEGVLREIAQREGFGLDATVELLDGVDENEVWVLADPRREQTFKACLDVALAPATLEKLSLPKEEVFVCRDVALTDTLAANLALQCRLKVI